MRTAAALAVLLGAAACGRGAGEAAAAPSAGRIDIDLVLVNAESSKDSHETTETFRLSRGQLRASRLLSGYGDEESPPTSALVAVDEAALVRLIELCRARHLDQDARQEGALLQGPGNLITYHATVTVDGKTGHTKLEVPQPWNGPEAAPSELQKALDELRLQLSVIAHPPKY